MHPHHRPAAAPPDARPTAPDPVLNEAQTAALTGLSRRTLQRYRLEGGGPRFIRLGEARVGYRRSDLDAWLSARTFASTAEETVQRGQGAS